MDITQEIWKGGKQEMEIKYVKEIGFIDEM
jgi:hypothetical protein